MREAIWQFVITLSRRKSIIINPDVYIYQTTCIMKLSSHKI